ncbi:Intradiol ring-cleavage dioxygenase [Podospora didyma]|uniref:Intradiol ring-cleavage dioxygenase n=1 Tax=Podospora didyma TaxID=330526 RepID=A0AAE0K037_9PEZI|nr:Intradiol ring-cleavage dioxygenase [Podospora didyma]
MHLLRICLVFLGLVTFPIGYGDLGHEIAARATFSQFNKMSLAHCAERLAADRVHENALRLRVDILRNVVQARDDKSPINVDHSANGENFTTSTSPEDLFAQFKSVGRDGYVLAPESTEGPFYVDGEYNRSDLAEAQVGVLLCCNSTGVYGGIKFKEDPGKIHYSWLRGLQETKADGSVYFSALVPGHYTDRCPHVHVATHINATVLPNGTIFSNAVSHAGQFIFDQPLLDTVFELDPCTLNTNLLVKNVDDAFLVGESQTSDPFFEWAYVNTSSPQAGVLAWIAFGVNLTHVRHLSPAATFPAVSPRETAISGL